MKKSRKPASAETSSPANPGLFLRFVSDPLNIISVTVFLVWAIVGIWFRPIGGYGVETDFYGDFVPNAREWAKGIPSVGLGYRGPFYYLLIGALSKFGDVFLLAKILSAACAGIGIRAIGGLFRNLWNTTVATAGSLFLAANSTLILYSYKACTDLVYLVLFVTTLALVFSKNRGHYKTWAAAGLMAGMAYLTRYNGVALVPIGMAAGLIMVRPWRRMAMTILAFGGSWLVIVSPWLLYLWNQTGDPFWNRNFALIAEEIYGLNSKVAGTGHLVDSVGFTSLGEVFRLDPGASFLAMAVNFPEHLWMDLKLLVGPVWGVLGMAGIALSFRTWSNRRCLAFALAGLITFTALSPVFYNQRFMLTLLIWWAAGFGGLVDYLANLFGRLSEGRSRSGGILLRPGVMRNTMFLILGLAVILASFQGIRQSQGAGGGKAMPLAVLKLAKTVQQSGLVFGDDTPIAARKPHIGYYLGAPVGSLSTQSRLNDMAATGMHYLLVSNIESSWFPTLANMLTDRRPSRAFPGYRFVAAATARGKSGTKQTAALYAVENPATWERPSRSGIRTPPQTPEGLDRIDYLRSRLALWYLNWVNDQPVFGLFDLMKPQSRIHPRVMEAEGDVHLGSRQYNQAASIFRSLAEQGWKPGDTILRLAFVDYLSGDTRGFEQKMNEFISQGKMDSQPTMNDWIDEAVIRFQGKDYAPAAALFINIRRLYPDLATGQDYKFLGHCYMNLRHGEKARAAFGKALEITPDDPAITTFLKFDARLREPRR